MSSYIKFLSRNKLYTVIEAIGLIVSIAFVILIGNYVYQQYSVAYGNPYRNRVYAVGNQDYLSLSWWDKAVFEDKLPEAETVARISGSDYDGYITFGDEQPVSAVITEADPEIFDLFPSLTLLEGSMDEYRLKGHCLVSESLANRAFNGDAVGKPLKIKYLTQDKIESTVCGVFKDSKNSMMPRTEVMLNPEFDDMYVSQQPFSSIGQYMTLMKVSEGTDREKFAKKVEEVGLPNYGGGFVKAMPIYNLPELYFNDEQWMFKQGNKPVLQMLTMVVLLLLVSAIFNYINLNMALSGKRAKEMATRRLHGATKGEIVMKYIAEFVSFTAVCFVLAFLLAYALLPMMNDLLRGVSGGTAGSLEQFVSIRFEWSVGIVAAYVLTVVVLGVLSGIAPAAIASRFEPIDVVRGTYRLQTKRVFSKVFIVFQNTITIVLIAMAILMEVQMRHMMNRPINMRSEGLYVLKNWAKEYSDIVPLIDRLEKIPNVRAVGYGRGFAGQLNMGTSVETPDGETVNMQLILCDETYFDMLGLQVVEDFGVPKTNSVWMSKALANKLSVNDSTASYYARRMRINGSRPETVGGIYENIPTLPASASEPDRFSAVIIAKAEDLVWGNGVMIDVSSDYKGTEKAILEVYREYSEEQNGTFVEAAQNGYVKDLNNLSLQPVKMAMRLLELFMLLSVLISLLGLVAMSTYYSEQSTKSIAVRKVFGSNVQRELWRTVKDYMVLVGIAALIGIPLAVWFCGRYLDRFAYRIEHYGWIIAVAAILGMLMAFLSVLWQTLKAARTNPAEALKKE